MNTLLIEKQTGGYFKFTLNGDTANAITSINNDLLAVGNQLHFKTGNGANIIKEQFIYPADVTIVSGGTFTFTTVAQVWDKLIAIDYFAWLGGGSTGGVDRFDDLLDTFSYTGNAGKAVVVDNSELKLVPITLYNKRLFTELEDTPSSLVPNKMVVVNPAGTALIFQDQPEPPAEYLNSVGYFDYNDLATQTTPLSAVANVALKLTNDTEGANTSTDQNPYGVSYVWDYTTNQFNFSELEVGDTIDVRVHVQITTTTSNQKVSLSAKFGIGSVAEFTNSIFETTFKSSGLHEISFVAPFYMGSTYITDYPAELYLTTDASATVKVDGWYVRILRKNINIITVDYQVEDATTTTKGIVRLAGDLSGTANNPTVPELANKVPTSRTVSTTSPLLGGGALSSNLSLSIQQSNSVDSGYLSNVDWITFNGKANDNAVVKLTGDQSIAGDKTFTTTNRTTFQNGDAAQITFKNTGDLTKTLNIGYGSNGNIISSTGLDFRVGGLTSSALLIASNENATFKENLTAKSFIKSGGTSSQFLKADGSVDSNNYALTSQLHDAVTIGTTGILNGLSLSGQVLSLATASSTTRGALTAEDYNYFFAKQNALTNPVTGTGTSGQIAYWNGTNTQTGDNGLSWNNTSKFLSVTGTNGTINYRGNQIQFLRNSDNYITANGASAILYFEIGGAWRWRFNSDGNFISNGAQSISTSTGNLTISTLGGSGNILLTPNLTGNTQISSNTLIGTTTDAGYKLDVNGTGRFSGNTTISGGNVNTGSKLTLAWNDTDGAFIQSYASKPLLINALGNNVIFNRDGGNVGIGTISPTTYSGFINLSVGGSSRGLISIRNNANNEVGFLYNPSGNVLGLESILDNLTLTSASGKDLIFNTSGANERIRITSGGNVGIGTPSPSSKLHIIQSSFNPLRIARDSVSDYSFELGGSGEFYIKNNLNSVYPISILSSGNVLIGTTTDAGYKLDVNGSVKGNTFKTNYESATNNVMIGAVSDMGSNYFPLSIAAPSGTTVWPFGIIKAGTALFRVTNIGDVLVAGSVTASGGFFNSDIRLKDLTDYDYNVSDIKPITYLWKDGRDNKKHVGYSAQQVQKVMPDAVNEDQKGFLSVNYVEVLVAKIAELENRIKQLEK